jgi:UDP-N-acetylglucosamine 2-epimerase (hydrolysing)
LTEKKKVVFLTGTRADFGKLKPLINSVRESDLFESYIFVTGMHTLSKYGSTYDEVEKIYSKNVFVYMNQTSSTDLDIILANTITGFSNFIKEIKPDLIIIHGDRVEALAGTIVGSLNNILVGHIEGGELSGNIDELMRHAITKLAHIHFVANLKAKRRLMQMGESQKNIFVIGSPEIDVMKSENLPTLTKVKKRYEIKFDTYSIFIFHPLSTELNAIFSQVHETISALILSKKNYIIIYPNNDKGSEIIINEFKRLKNNNHFKIFPSLRFEYYLTLLKNSNFIIGNSSSGIREAEIFGTSTINLGNRQKNRSSNKNIIHIEPNEEKILQAINNLPNQKVFVKNTFGDGKSKERFLKILKNPNTWKISIEKQFIDFIVQVNNVNK